MPLVLVILNAIAVAALLAAWFLFRSARRVERDRDDADAARHPIDERAATVPTTARADGGAVWPGDLPPGMVAAPRHANRNGTTALGTAPPAPAPAIGAPAAGPANGAPAAGPANGAHGAPATGPANGANGAATAGSAPVPTFGTATPGAMATHHVWLPDEDDDPARDVTVDITVRLPGRELDRGARTAVAALGRRGLRPGPRRDDEIVLTGRTDAVRLSVDRVESSLSLLTTHRVAAAALHAVIEALGALGFTIADSHEAAIDLVRDSGDVAHVVVRTHRSVPEVPIAEEATR